MYKLQTQPTHEKLYKALLLCSRIAWFISIFFILLYSILYDFKVEIIAFVVFYNTNKWLKWHIESLNPYFVTFEISNANTQYAMETDRPTPQNKPIRTPNQP